MQVDNVAAVAGVGRIRVNQQAVEYRACRAAGREGYGVTAPSLHHGGGIIEGFPAQRGFRNAADGAAGGQGDGEYLWAGFLPQLPAEAPCREENGLRHGETHGEPGGEPVFPAHINMFFRVAVEGGRIHGGDEFSVPQADGGTIAKGACLINLLLRIVRKDALRLLLPEGEAHSLLRGGECGQGGQSAQKQQGEEAHRF